MHAFKENLKCFWQLSGATLLALPLWYYPKSVKLQAVLGSILVAGWYDLPFLSVHLVSV